jgi:hypothetical protein
MTACEYSLSISILILCYCVISLFFFVMFNLHDIINNDDGLIIPWLILTSVLALCLFISNCLITDGFSIFCSNLVFSDNKENGYLQGQCRRAQIFEWKKVVDGAFPFYNYFLVLIVSFWFAFLNLLFICFLLILRIRFNSKIKEHKLIVKVAETFTNLHGKRRRRTNDKAFAESQL